jgi:hypothetical protein
LLGAGSAQGLKPEFEISIDFGRPLAGTRTQHTVGRTDQIAQFIEAILNADHIIFSMSR